MTDVRPPVIDNRTFKELFNLYDFYKTKDGEECLPKTYFYTKYATVGGAVFSVYEMVLISQPKTLYSTFARMGHFTFPLAGVGFTFGASLCILGHLRKKDDPTNHFIAGALAGSIYGFKYNRVSTGHIAGVLLGLLASYHKYFHVNNLPIMEMRRHKDTTYEPMFDFSIKIYDDPGRPDRAI